MQARYPIRYFTLMMVLSIGIFGCQAFNDHDEEGPIVQELREQQSLTEEGGEGEVLEETPSEGSGDESSAKALCEVMTAIEVSVDEEADVTESIMNGETAATGTSSIDASTIKIAILQEDSLVTLVIQNMDDGSYGVCAASQKAGNADEKVASGGSIAINKFNEADGDKVINSGTYSLTFAESNDAAKAARMILGAKVEGDTTAEGSYYSDALAASGAE